MLVNIANEALNWTKLKAYHLMTTINSTAIHIQLPQAVTRCGFSCHKF